MNAFFADHPGTNYLTAKDSWTLSGGSGTTVVEFTDTVEAGALQTVTDSVSWDIVIPSTSEPYNWWSLWVHGEAGVDVAPIPEPGTMMLLGLGLAGLAAAGRRRSLH